MSTLRDESPTRGIIVELVDADEAHTSLAVVGPRQHPRSLQ